MPIDVKQLQMALELFSLALSLMTYALPEPPPVFVCLQLSDPLCEHLLLTQAQKEERKASGYSQVYSAYDHSHDKVYHLHPDLVDNRAGNPSIFVCQQC